jgi:hypothetical protein
MMGLDNIVNGIKLLQDYYLDPSGSHLLAAEGYIRLGPTDQPLTDHSYMKMKELGWFQPFPEKRGVYDPEEPWVALFDKFV